MGNKIEMTAGQKKEVKELVKGLCANYDRVTGDCLLMDAACYQACNFTGLCRYFKEAVLPANKLLYAQLVKLDSIKSCSVCGKSFVAASNRSKYCDGCSKAVRRRKEAERLRRFRSA
jgi:hypothetical protein